MTSGGRRIRLLASTVVLVALTAVTSLAQAFDPERTFTPGAFALSLGGGGGEQASFSAASRETIDLWWIDGRASWVPFGTVGKDGPFYGALEAGLEPIYQQYFGRASGYWAGLGLAARYHFLAPSAARSTYRKYAFACGRRAPPRIWTLLAGRRPGQPARERARCAVPPGRRRVRPRAR